MMTLEIKNLDGIQRLFINLGPKLEKEIMTKSEEFMKGVQKSAKLRAPKFTGYLASSIFVNKVGEKSIVLQVTAPWAMKMETGEGLPQYVPISELLRKGWAARSGSGYVIASRTRGDMLVKGSLPYKKGYFRVTHYKPFIMPALETNISKLPQMLSNATHEAIIKARG
jgi:hypothetical protein